MIHSTAVLDRGARVGAGTEIWHHSHIRNGAVIGNGCTIGKNVYIDEGVTIGDMVKVQNNASVYNGVTLGDRVFVGPSAVFTNDRFPRVGADSWNLVSTRVESDASICANATIVCGVTIHTFAIVGAGAVVTRDVLAHQVVVGNPARHHAWACACGTIVSRDVAAPESFACDECSAPS